MEYLHFDEFGKNYDMNMVASKHLGASSSQLESKKLNVADLTVKYFVLHKIAMSNWWLTTHYSNIREDFTSFLSNVGAWKNVNLGQIIQDCSIGH